MAATARSSSGTPASRATSPSRATWIKAADRLLAYEADVIVPGQEGMEQLRGRAAEHTCL